MSYQHEIKITMDNHHDGYIEGSIDDFAWFAIVEVERVDYAIDSRTLRKGTGRITRLCIYKEDQNFEGNPYMPSMSIKRMIYANFHHEWSVLNNQMIGMVRELVTYLERRYSVHVV